jgi:hypothetical protein
MLFKRWNQEYLYEACSPLYTAPSSHLAVGLIFQLSPLLWHDQAMRQPAGTTLVDLLACQVWVLINHICQKVPCVFRLCGHLNKEHGDLWMLLSLSTLENPFPKTDTLGNVQLCAPILHVHYAGDRSMLSADREFSKIKVLLEKKQNNIIPDEASQSNCPGLPGSDSYRLVWVEWNDLHRNNCLLLPPNWPGESSTLLCP